jgi:hypothetical protein
MTKTRRNELKKTNQKTKTEFGALILSHGRADNVYTVDTLKKQGYTGPIKFVIDDEDEQVEKYRERFGAENVIVFDKKASASLTDVMDNQGHLKGVVYARNVSFEIAKNLGWKYFIMLDDDYTSWSWVIGSDRRHHIPIVVSLDRVFAALLDFMKSTPAITIATIQAGDLIGGKDSRTIQNIDLGQAKKRKAMNTFIFDVDKPMRFLGRVNEDVNAYLEQGVKGGLVFATNCVKVIQPQTQKNAGGLTDIYLDQGTYVKSFYSVMFAPSCVKVQPFITKNMRWHHRINWRHAIPKLLSESVKKKA